MENLLQCDPWDMTRTSGHCVVASLVGTLQSLQTSAPKHRGLKVTLCHVALVISQFWCNVYSPPWQHSTPLFCCSGHRPLDANFPSGHNPSSRHWPPTLTQGSSLNSAILEKDRFRGPRAPEQTVDKFVNLVKNKLNLNYANLKWLNSVKGVY